jgi:hypothetical protein
MAFVEGVQWIAVESSVFTAAAYRRAARQLYLRFHDGSIYRYFDVPSQTFQHLLAAGSKGTYFSDQIRNRFRHEKVHRGIEARLGCDSSIAEQLSRSLLMATARAGQRREAAQAAGVRDATC